MIKKITLSIFIIGLCFLAYNFTSNVVWSNDASAPPKHTGSPGDAANCTACHNGTPTTVTGWITSDIPSVGYTPGNTYSITATATDASTNKFGFEISPQLTSGNPLGQMQGMLIVTNTTETKLVSTTGSNDNKYITHRAAGTTGSGNTKSWTFQWLAPTTTPKSVTFYGAFVAGTSTSSDKTYLSSLTRGVYTAGLNEEAFANAINLQVYPNPASTFTSVSLFNEMPAVINIQLYDIAGNLVKQISKDKEFSGNYFNTLDLTNCIQGIYLMKVEIDRMSCYKKIIIS